MTKFPSEDLVCAITLELPWDPVTAEDGRVYERTAIEQHIQTQKNGNLKSPMTNAPMGERLFPAPQTKNVIEALIQNGVLTGDLVSNWHEKVKEKKKMENLLKKADSGDAEAMMLVGYGYHFGCYGFKKDHQAAYSFYSKAHDTGLATATAMLGHCVYLGVGVAKRNTPLGKQYLELGAEKGSRLAAWLLAMTLAHGYYGMEVDKKEAIRWCGVVVKGGYAINDLSQKQAEKAKKLLDELTGVAN